MFTGIIEHLGEVKEARHEGEGMFLTLSSDGIFTEAKNGDSVAVNGVCLTVIGKEAGQATFELGPETLRRSTLGSIQVGDTVNLELPLRMSDRLGGHFVQGHVDDTAEIISYEKQGATVWMTLRLPEAAAPYLLPKGSIAVDGISLTIAEKSAPTTISIMLMDYTLKKTDLSQKKVGDKVNIEYDMLAKMLYQMTKERL